MNTKQNHFIPLVLDTAELEPFIRVRQYVEIGSNVVSIIESNPEILSALDRLEPGQLAPFRRWKIKKSGNIEFTTIPDFPSRFMLPAKHAIAGGMTKHQLNSNINPAAMDHIHGFRDIRSAQANDRDDEPNGEY